MNLVKKKNEDAIKIDGNEVVDSSLPSLIDQNRY